MQVKMSSAEAKMLYESGQGWAIFRGEWHPDWSAYEKKPFGGRLLEHTKYGWTEWLYISLKGQDSLYRTKYMRYPRGHKDLSIVWMATEDDDDVVVFTPVSLGAIKAEAAAEISELTNRYKALFG